MKVKKFNRPSKERRALTRNQATDLIMKGKIETTVAKAKYLKSYVEKLITLGVRTYDKVVTVMYVNKQLNSYNNYYAMQMYPEALDSLLKGLQKYDRHLETAGQLGVVDVMDYVRAQIIRELKTTYSMNEKKAYEIINMDTQEAYSQKVIEAAQVLN